MMEVKALVLTLLLHLTTSLASDCPLPCKCDDSLLDCRWTNLTDLPALEDFTAADLRNNNFTSVTLRAEYVNLETLDASSCSVSLLSVSVPQPSLLRLHLHHNLISSVSQSHLSRLPQLQLLDLADNSLSSIPERCFSDLTQLQTLDLSGNQLQELHPSSLDGLHSLLHLSLARNSLVSVPSFESLHSLTSLSLDHNRLVSLAAFTVNPQLKQLSVSHNHLVQLAPTLFQNNHRSLLTHLDISFNGFTFLPSETLQSLHQLQDFDFSGNNISLLPAFSFDGQYFGRLQSVAMNAMPLLSNISEQAFASLDSLLFLHMHSCPLLTTIADGAFDCPSIQSMDLHSCNISSISKEILTDWQQLQLLDVRHNPLRCDCDLIWLKDLRSAFHSQPFCSSPPALHMKPLSEVARSEMTCNQEGDRFFEDRIMIAIFTGTCLFLLLVGGALMFKYRHSMCEQTQPGVDVYSYFVYHNPNRMARHHNIPPRRLQAKPRDPNRSLRHVTWSSTDIEPYRPKDPPKALKPKETEKTAKEPAQV